MTTGYVGPNGQWVEVANTPSGPTAWLSSLAAPILIAKTNQVFTRESVNAAGDSTFTALTSFILPAGIMGPNGSLIYEYEVSYTNSASTKQFRLQIGATAITPETPGTTTTNYNQRGEWHNTSLTTQKYRGSFSKQGPNTTGFITTAIDTSADQTVDFMGRWLAAAASEVIGLESLRVWVEYGA